MKTRDMNNRETWYLLFGGTSVDGMGQGKYIGRTTDKEVAHRHYQACVDNPYSIGKVIIVTDTDYQQAGWLTNWDDPRRHDDARPGDYKV